jgi:small subunit ribosomal protein S1
MVDEEKEEQNFAQLFEESTKRKERRFFPGDVVEGRVIQIGKENVFIDLGGKSEGTVDLQEFRDEEGNLNVREGDSVELKVVSVRKGIHLSKSIKPRGAEALEMLRLAHQNRIPVEGRVAALNKGGFEIDLAGLRGFCPLSQIDLGYCEKLEEHLNARYTFRVTEIGEKGKNIILSRRVLLEEEQEKRAQATLAKIQPDMILDGKITRLMDFGAFVDIGGVEGMVHVSEISHGRIKHPSEILAAGQAVKVKVLRIEAEKGGRPRIALSIKALEPEIWDQGFAFREGDVISGRVTRLVDFGAFIEIARGVEGLVHISEISYEKIPHPSRALKEGQAVEVLVQKIDPENRRISLSIKDAAIKQKMPRDAAAVREVGQILQGIVEDQKPYGLFVRLPQLGMNVRGLLPLEELLEGDKGDLKKKYPRGKELTVEIIALEEDKIRLSQRSMKEKKDREEFENYLQKEGRGPKLGTLGEALKRALK